MKTKALIRKTNLLVLALFCTVNTGVNTANAEVRWNIVPEKTSIKFKIKHFVLMNVAGKFKSDGGTVVTPTADDFSGAQVKATIPVSSVYTGNSDRDSHLLQDVFFNQSEFPKMEFKSTSVEKSGPGTYVMKGTISIRGVNQPIELDVEHVGSKVLKDGTVCCRFKAVGKLNRYDFGLKWNELTEYGGMVVDDTVKIVLNVAMERSS